MAAAGILALFEELQQRIQLGGPQRARPADLLLVLGQVRWQTALAQDAHGSGTQFSQIKLLGLAMLHIIIPAGAAIARRQTHRFKATSSVAGPPVMAFIDIA